MTSEGSGLRLADFLDHIAEAARLAREYVGGMSQESFLQDRRTQQAVVLNLMTIGEAAARIANEHKDFATAHPEIPWAQMRGMRNRSSPSPHHPNPGSSSAERGSRTHAMVVPGDSQLGTGVL